MTLGSCSRIVGRGASSGFRIFCPVGPYPFVRDALSRALRCFARPCSMLDEHLGGFLPPRLPSSFLGPGRCGAVCNRRVGGIRPSWVGRLFARASNCRPALPLVPSPSACVASWARSVSRVAYLREGILEPRCLAPPCALCGRGEHIRRAPWSRRMPRAERFAAEAHGVVARPLGCGTCRSDARPAREGGPPQVRIEPFVCPAKGTERNEKRNEPSDCRARR